MSDLNLMPQEFKIDKEKKIRRNIYVVIVVAALLVIAVVTYIPTYLALSVNKENREVEQDVSKLTYVTAEVSKLNAQKNALQDRINVLDSFTRQEIKWTGVISDMSALMPSDVSVNSMNVGRDLISMQCTSLSQQSIAAFVANIENSKKFSFDKINNITPDDKAKTFKFGISFKLNNEESKVK
jgi:type IV pilus assembly protein PilN